MMVAGWLHRQQAAVIDYLSAENRVLRERLGDRRIIFTGFVFGKDYRMLQQNAYCYVHATEVGGTHPALLEAMGYGNCVLTLATPENVEVIGQAGIPYADEADLVMQLQRVLRDGSLVHAYRLRAQERVKKYYDWEHVVDRYEELFRKMAGRKTIRDELSFEMAESNDERSSGSVEPERKIHSR